MAASRIKARPDPAQLVSRAAAVLAAAGVRPAAQLCVALSGGVDSVVLLHVLTGLRLHFGFTLSAAHVHHGLSPRADEWCAHCQSLCSRFEVPLTVLRVDVDRQHPDGLEAAARYARHAALRSLEVDCWAFGHHLDDQAETVLFRMLRGAGVRGAGAMTAVSANRLRPLLDVRRADIEAYARAHDLTWVEDESNADLRFSRNYLRYEVLPRIETSFPGAVSALARSARNFQEADALLDEVAEQDMAACGGHPMSRAALQGLPDGRVRNVLRWRMQCLGCDAPPRAMLFELVRQLREGAGTALHFPLGDWVCCGYRDEVWFELRETALPGPHLWRGEAALPWAGGRVGFEQVHGLGVARRLLEHEEVSLGLRGEGLKMRVTPGGTRRSFKNLCQESGVPPWLRGRLPVLYVAGEPVWIAGVGVSADAVCTAGEPGMLPRWERF